MLIIVLFLCLPFIFFANYSLNAAAAAAAAPTSPPSLSPDGTTAISRSYMWIVQGNSTAKLSPNCSDLCVAEFNNEPNFLAALQPCQGLSANEEWLYDPLALSITSKLGVSSNVTLCMDAIDPLQLQLISCNGSPSQMWTYDNQKMRFQGGNSSLADPPSYLMGQIRHPSDWGSGRNNYTLQLAAENSLESNEFGSVFTMLPLINPLLIEPTSYITSDSQNLVRNGGFEQCNDDPGKGFTTIDSTQPLYLCSWYVTSNEVEYSGTNLWQPQEGTHSLHLNSAKIGMPASVQQRLSTKLGSNYTLGFYMAGNPDINCGDTNKTMKMEVTPSSLKEQELWFDVSKGGSAGKMDYMYVYPMGFTAQADYVNLTFTSLTLGSCGPVIDNISVKEIEGPLPPLLNPHELSVGADSTSSGMPTYGKVLLGVAMAAAALITGIASLLIIKIKKKKRAIKQPAIIRMGSLRHNSKAAHAKWWASFKLEEGIDDTTSSIMELTWKQIEKATINFTTIVGEGGFSTVYRAEMADGRMGAVKMEKTRDRSRQIFKQELSILCRLRHPNLVNLIGFCNEREEGILVFEYMAHGSLHHRLHPPAHQRYVALGWKKRIEVAVQVAHALQYLHDVAKPAVVHGDIKSANVLLDEDDNAKLCDFGFSSKAGPNSSVFHSTVASVKGSLGYLDPQYLRNGRLSSKSDVYSFGVLLIEIMTGLHAFDMHRAEALTSFTTPYVQDMDMMELIVDARLSGKFDRSELRTMCNVARLCVQEDSASRPTMSEVVFQLSSSSTGLSSTTSEPTQHEDSNVSSSLSENLDHLLYNSFDSDFENKSIQSTRAT